MGRIKILSASAGSGKTYQLSYQYVQNVIDKPWLYRNILAVTFTNKATEEMKQRIIAEINALAGPGKANFMDTLQKDLKLPEHIIRERAVEVRTKILHDYSHFTILTIDKFFQRIIRSFIKELGIDINFNLELQTDSLLHMATDRLIDEIAVNEKLRNWVVRFVEEKIEDNKRWDIRADLAELGKEIFKERYKAISESNLAKEELEKIVSEASSKSYAITGKMKNLGEEALSIIASAGLSIDDFPYGSSGFVSYFLKRSKGIVEQPGKRVIEALSEPTKWYAKNSPHREIIDKITPQLMPILTELCDIYEKNHRFLQTTILLRENFRSFALLNDLAGKVNEICAEQNLVPISETNTILQKLISGNDTPFIYEKVGTHFSHFMIDEFQDTSRQQWDNFIPLLQNAVAQSEDSAVLLVGDVKQSIYRWRGGDWQILRQQVTEQFRKTEFHNLKTNFRSDQLIVDFNNQMIESIVKHDDAQIQKLLDTAVENSVISEDCQNELQGMISAAYIGHAQKSARQNEQGYVRIAEQETSPIIPIVEELQERGYTPSDIAIIVHYNQDAVRIAAEMLDHKSTHPESQYSYNVVTQEALTIGNAPVAGFIIAIFTLATNPTESIQRAVYNQYLGRTFDQELSSEEKKFFQHLRLLPLEEAFEEVLLQFNLHTIPENIAYIQALQEQVLLFGASRISDIPLFLKWWNEIGANQSISLPERNDAITIITIHKAKGLQYKAVILPYCNWPLNPKANSVIWTTAKETPFNIFPAVPVNYKKTVGDSFFAENYYRETVLAHIDNINLFYVAATRAEHELFIWIPQSGRVTEKRHIDKNRISSLILGTLQSQENSVTLGVMKGEMQINETGAIYTFGKPGYMTKPMAPQKSTTIYPTRQIGTRLKFNLGSQRYFEDTDSTEKIELSPRSYGMIMHRIFENITDDNQIDEQLQQMRNNGTISEEEATKTRQTIERAFSNPLISSWFNSTWEVVRNENEIIMPGEYAIRRPDRVLTKGKTTVVIDYKFGKHLQKRYTSQLREYMKLLERMGYQTIQGYIWYVEQEKIEEVTLPEV